MFTKNAKGKLNLKDTFLRVRTPNVVALARTVDPTISSSAEIVLNKKTSIIRVYAFTKDVYLRWGTSDVSATTFDEVIPAGQVMDFLIPENITAINLIEREATAGVIVIEK